MVRTLTQGQKDYIDMLQSMNRQQRRAYEKRMGMPKGTIPTTNVPQNNKETKGIR